jgi:hypothetical protein
MGSSPSRHDGDMRKDGVRLLVAIGLAAIALLAVSGSLSGPARWSPDGLFYQARVYEIRDGLSQAGALHKAFEGPLGARLRVIDPQRSGDPAWVAYNARFYERRLLVPLAASALQPLAGDRAILDVSLAGYVAAVLALFWLLLLLGVRLPVAAAVGLATVFLPALTHHAGLPLTDSWGLALETAAFATAILVLRRGARWLIPWGAAIALLSLTRDSMWIPVLAAGFLAVTQRTRLTTALAATGLAAALPAVLAIRVPMRELLAEMVTNGLQPAPDASWPTVAGHYPGAIVDMLQADGGFVRDGAWYTAMFLLAGLVLLFVVARGSHGGRAATLLKAGAVAGAAYVVAVPVFSAFRLELVLVPMAAFGLALTGERIANAIAVRAGRERDPARSTEIRSLPPSRKSGPSPQAAFGDLTSKSS